MAKTQNWMLSVAISKTTCRRLRTLPLFAFARRRLCGMALESFPKQSSLIKLRRISALRPRQRGDLPPKPHMKFSKRFRNERFNVGCCGRKFCCGHRLPRKWTLELHLSSLTSPATLSPAHPKKNDFSRDVCLSDQASRISVSNVV